MHTHTYLHILILHIYGHGIYVRKTVSHVARVTASVKWIFFCHLDGDCLVSCLPLLLNRSGTLTEDHIFSVIFPLNSEESRLPGHSHHVDSMGSHTRGSLLRFFLIEPRPLHNVDRKNIVIMIVYYNSILRNFRNLQVFCKRFQNKSIVVEVRLCLSESSLEPVDCPWKGSSCRKSVYYLPSAWTTSLNSTESKSTEDFVKSDFNVTSSANVSSEVQTHQ